MDSLWFDLKLFQVKILQFNGSHKIVAQSMLWLDAIATIIKLIRRLPLRINAYDWKSRINFASMPYDQKHFLSYSESRVHPVWNKYWKFDDATFYFLYIDGKLIVKEKIQVEKLRNPSDFSKYCFVKSTVPATRSCRHTAAAASQLPNLHLTLLCWVLRRRWNLLGTTKPHYRPGLESERHKTESCWM